MFKIVLYVPFMSNIQGMALYPFIILKHRYLQKNKLLMNHEEIHLQQQKELLVLPFYIFYLANYLFNLIRYRNHYMAYRNICFEREAYSNEHNLDYLKKRELFAFRKYF